MHQTKGIPRVPIQLGTEFDSIIKQIRHIVQTDFDVVTQCVRERPTPHCIVFSDTPTLNVFVSYRSKTVAQAYASVHFRHVYTKPRFRTVYFTKCLQNSCVVGNADPTGAPEGDYPIHTHAYVLASTQQHIAATHLHTSTQTTSSKFLTDNTLAYGSDFHSQLRLCVYIHSLCSRSREFLMFKNVTEYSCII